MHLDAFHTFKLTTDDDQALCLDAQHYGNISRFLNHRCQDANLIDMPIKIDS